MKKLLSILLCSALLASNISAFAIEEIEPASENYVTVTSELTEEAIPETPSETEPTYAPAENSVISDTVKIDITVTAPTFTNPSTAVFELYSPNGELLGTKSETVNSYTKNLTLEFTVPEYTIGESFSLKLVSGLTYVKYYNDYFYEGSLIKFGTYLYKNDNGESMVSNGIAIDALPYFDKSVNISYNGKKVDLYPGAKVIDGVAMVPIRKLAEAVGMEVKYDEKYNVEVVSIGDKSIYFNVDTVYTTVFGRDLNAPHKTIKLNDTIYVALRTFSDAVGSTLDIKDNYTSLDISMSNSPIVKEFFDSALVNRNGIASRTPYLVWVSLSEYKVRLYMGEQYHWKLLREMPCAIGAPSTPSITGQYEYQYKAARWDYGSYYVGPCLIFHGGYALHSVLLRQNNTEYDGRVGVMISHGCIRMKKKDIDYVASLIPVKTKIYLTK